MQEDMHEQFCKLSNQVGSISNTMQVSAVNLLCAYFSNIRHHAEYKF